MMKFFSAICFSAVFHSIFCLEANAQANEWTWLSGNNIITQAGRYGTKNVADPANIPGGRYNAVNWLDKNGNFWLFGGQGGYISNADMYVFNDVWKWDGSNWTWTSGSNQLKQPPIYGIKGTPAAVNSPGQRLGSTGCTDSSGNFWLFGGTAVGNGGYSAGNGSPYDEHNDLWKWDGSNWTWISGPDSSFNSGSRNRYRLKGVPDSFNLPGARLGAASWIDKKGNFWLFGGGDGDYSKNDIWKWDGVYWTFLKGSDTMINTITAVYGTKGVADPANLPGQRSNSVYWTDKNGNCWMFGGYNYVSGQSSFNDLWKWDGNNWTWVNGSNSPNQTGNYGIKGIADTSNIPHARYAAASWVDDHDNVWLFGGSFDSLNNLNPSSYATYYLSDLWKWDGTRWTWVSGNTNINNLGNYGNMGNSAASNIPPARSGSVTWKDRNGNFWLFGGLSAKQFSRPSYAYGYISFNDLWKWDGSNWTWVSGSKYNTQKGYYGIQGISDPSNKPGARSPAASWFDKTGNLWLFGGYGYDSSYMSSNLNDLWKWDGKNWTWMNGSGSINQSGIFGNLGVPDPLNVPPARESCSYWRDLAGNFWIFGGNGSFDNSNYSYGNDLWKWDGSNWTFIRGSQSPNPVGIYGTMGLAAAVNTPGARIGSATWTDSFGNFWLFGGDGYSSFNSGSGIPTGGLNDFWKWDGNNWTWMGGSKNLYDHGNNGSKGIPVTSNYPAARNGSIACTDKNNNLWMFGGILDTIPLSRYSSPNPPSNELWKWDGTNWTWLSGDNKNAQSIYGTKGIAASTNMPATASGNFCWVDNNNNFWLYTGNAKNASGNIGFVNQIWKWDGSNWTWVSGDSTLNLLPVYGSLGIASSGNKPGQRSGSAYWKDDNNNIWLFGGRGQSETITSYLNDLWVYNYALVTAINSVTTPSTPSIFLLNNPSSLNQFSLLSNTFYKKLSWQLMDNNGRIMQSGEFNNVTKGIVNNANTFNLPAGIYIIRLLGDGKVLPAQKWIKQ